MSGGKTQSPLEVTAKEARRATEQGVSLVDIRSAAEQASGMAEGSVAMTWAEVQARCSDDPDWCVNLVCAGPLRTIAARSNPGFDRFEEVWAGRAPLGWDVDDPEPAARACVALLSPWFPATTGEMVHVDGGFHAVGATPRTRTPACPTSGSSLTALPSSSSTRSWPTTRASPSPRPTG